MANPAVAGSKQAVPEQAGGIITSQYRRKLPTVAFKALSVVSLDVPRDDVFKRAVIRGYGSFSVTFASGSPVLSPMSWLSRMIARLDIVQNGQDTLKSVDLHMIRMQNLLLSGVTPERAYSTSASAFTTAEALTEAEFQGPAYPVTTQFVLINESCVISFEQPFCYEAGRSVSLWNTKGLSSAEIRFNFSSLSNLIVDGNAAAVTYADDIAMSFDVELLSAPSVSRAQDFMLYKQSVRRYTFSGAQRDTLIDLPRGNLITGIHLLARNGDTNRTLSDIVLTDIMLQVNGQRIIQKSTFRNLQRENRIQYGVHDYRATASSGVTHAMQGYAYMGLLRDGDVRTSLDSRVSNNVDLLQLVLSTGASAGTDAVTYTNPVEISVMTDELSAPISRV